MRIRELVMRDGTLKMGSEYFTGMELEEHFCSLLNRPFFSDIFKRRKLEKTLTSLFIVSVQAPDCCQDSPLCINICISSYL